MQILRKSALALAVCTAILLPAVAFAEEDDDFFISMDEDYSDSYSQDESGSAGGNVNVSQGLWIEATSDTQAIIRDIATGEKNGYEIDNSHFKSFANWWFWGDINKNFQLDAEIGVWNFDKVMYKANSYGANVPDVTIGDGLQSLGTMIFSPLANGNDDGIGAFNKMALNFKSPFVNVRFGYGNLKANGMTSFEGIYNVLDRWNDVGKGYTEISNGKEIQRFGDIKINALAAFSQMRGTYGMYDLLDVKYGDNYRVALTFGSYTNQEQLFFYDQENLNAASIYLSAQPVAPLKFEAHGLGTFGTDVNFGESSIAGAGRVTYTGAYGIKTAVTVSYAGENASSVWGADGQPHDNICADSVYGQVDFEVTPLDYLTVALDAGVQMNDVSALSDGLMQIRVQPNVDFDLSGVSELSGTIAAYAVISADRLAVSTSADQEVIFFMEEAGLEFVTDMVPFAKKLTADWAIKPAFKTWESGNVYELDTLYNSLMVTADLNDKINVHLGGLLRTGSEDKTVVPFGIAAGVKVNNTVLPGKPHFWAHVTYGLSPYGENNYTLYRADNILNKPTHRTYLLSDLESVVTSNISFGLIWDLK